MSRVYAALLFYVLSTLSGTYSYVLVQVRKGDNQSNVDALIHKVLPSEKFQEIADTARKHFSNYKKFKVASGKDDSELESIVFAVNTDSPTDENGSKEEQTEKITKKIMKFFKKYLGGPSAEFRSKLESFNIRPEIVHFKSGKPSVLYNINVKGIVKYLNNVLSSRVFKNYADTIVKKAAFAYRAFKDEIDRT